MGEIPDYKSIAVWNGAIERQIAFLGRKHNELPFVRRLRIHKEHVSVLSKTQKKIVSDLYLGIECAVDDGMPALDSPATISPADLTPAVAIPDDDSLTEITDSNSHAEKK